MHPAAGRSLSPETTEAVRAGLREALLRDFGGNASVAARKLGLSQPPIIRMAG